MSTLENYLLISLFFVFLLVFYRWLKRYLRRNDITESFPYVYPFEKKELYGRETVQIELPKGSAVRIEILTDDGDVVDTAFDGNSEKGTHIYGFDCTVLNPGAYDLRITFSNQITTRSFIVPRRNT